jgi:dienelactone hydrolase
VKTAAVLPDRIGAGASFHGGGLVTDKPDSPHLLAPKIKARMYFAVASNDDARQPDAKDKLKEAFAAAKVPAEIEVYSGALHGWCVADMPMQNVTPYALVLGGQTPHSFLCTRSIGQEGRACNSCRWSRGSLLICDRYEGFTRT